MKLTKVTGSSSASIPNNKQNDNAAVPSDISGSSSKSASNTLVKNVIVTGRKIIEENEKHHESDGNDSQKGDEGLKNTLVINSNEKNSNYNQPQEIQIEDEADDKMDEDDQMEEDDEVLDSSNNDSESEDNSVAYQGESGLICTCRSVQDCFTCTLKVTLPHLRHSLRLIYFRFRIQNSQSLRRDRRLKFAF